MKVRIELFATFKDEFGENHVEIEVNDGACVGDLRRELAELSPSIINLLERSRFAVNNQFTSDEAPVSDRDTVALIPPVSGG